MKVTSCLLMCFIGGLAGLLFFSHHKSKKKSTLVQPGKWWQVHPRPVYSQLGKIGTFQAWFDVYKLIEGTYAIYEPNQFAEVICYLVIGQERAVLIDTGNGIGNLKKVVSKLTDFPVSVILTHEHYDHVGAAHRFKDVAVFDNAAALEVLKAGRDNASLQEYIQEEYLWKPLPKDFDPGTWTIPPMEPAALLHDGDMIDLGGRTLEVIYTPGHSPGSICLLDRENRILFTGDHFSPGPLYAHTSDANIHDYIESYKKLVHRIAEYDYVCSGHNEPWVKSEVIPRVEKAFADIFAGKGKFSEADGVRRYYFDGFGILIRTEMIKKFVTGGETPPLH